VLQQQMQEKEVQRRAYVQGNREVQYSQNDWMSQAK
jgi:hypothetical protein